MKPSELKNKIRNLIPQIYNEKFKPEGESSPYQEINKFPTLKKVIVDLLTSEYNKFIESIDWVAPRPTTFRVNLLNKQFFYLSHNKKSWVADIEGKKYYLLNLDEEERAAIAISRILAYGEMDDENLEDYDDDDGSSNNNSTSSPSSSTSGESSEEDFSLDDEDVDDDEDIENT